LGSAEFRADISLPLGDYGRVAFTTTPAGKQEQKLLAAALCLPPMCMYR